MVEEILLHVGMHKTGTTALQKALVGYDDGRTRYAHLHGENHSIPFVTCFASDPFRYHAWQRLGASREHVLHQRARMRAQLDAEIALDRHRLLVIGEEISLLAPAAVQSMAETLRAAVPRTAILAYLREPLGYITSAFQQQVRGGQSCYSLPRPYYRARFQKFLDSFGPAALSFRAYAPERFPGKSVIGDYALAAGLPPDALPALHVNESLPLDALRLVHLLNRSTEPARSPAELAARSALIALIANRCSGPVTSAPSGPSSVRFTLPAEIAASAIDRDELAWIEDLSRVSFGPAPAAVDPLSAEAHLQALLATIPPQALEMLRAEHAARGLPHRAGDDPATLIAALYHSFLTAEKERRATAPRSASA